MCVGQISVNNSSERVETHLASNGKLQPRRGKREEEGGQSGTEKECEIK